MKRFWMMLNKVGGRIHCRLPQGALLFAACLLLNGIGTFTVDAAPPARGVRPLPRGMVYLKQIDPSIAQDMRYAGVHNFLGRPVAGYGAGECILTLPTAKALARIQARLNLRGLSLKMYDCYRPLRAVRDFVRWSADPTDVLRKTEFYRALRKRDLFKLHYISRKSKHSFGNTVDLTVIPLDSDTPLFDPAAPQRACDGPKAQRSADNSLDFGTAYDCFHRRSGRGLEPRFKAIHANRKMLRAMMRAQGFSSYSREWWHFQLRGARAPQRMDFPIQAMP